jgi:hypothetical protein
MTDLERRMYVALLGARTIVAATANVNPQALRIKNLIDQVAAAYKAQLSLEPAEVADGAGD